MWIFSIEEDETYIYWMLNPALQAHEIDDVTVFVRFGRDLQKRSKEENRNFTRN